MQRFKEEKKKLMNNWGVYKVQFDRERERTKTNRQIINACSYTSEVVEAYLFGQIFGEKKVFCLSAFYSPNKH